MTLTAIILITFSIFFHVTWNLMTKGGKPCAAFFFVLTFATVIVLTPFLLWDFQAMKSIPAKFWWLLAGTGFFETMYYMGLAQGYRNGDISLVYPLIRALPVLLVPLFCSVLGIGKPLSFAAVSGMVLIGCGCIVMMAKDVPLWNFRSFHGSVMLGVIMASFGTVGYTIIDSEAIQLLDTEVFSVPTNIIYNAFINIAILPWLLMVLIAFSRWRDFKKYRGKNMLRPAMAGIISCFCYMFVLAAMKCVSNVSYVAGFRQLSIPLGMVLGVFVFKEKVILSRVIGCIIVVIGLILTALY